jgi:hypothetical protein
VVVPEDVGVHVALKVARADGVMHAPDAVS